MFLSKIFKFILILSVIGSVYLFGVISLKFSIFPFSYNLTGLVSWTSEQIFGKEINSYEKNKINSSYNESYTSLLFDFDVTWFSIDFKDSYGAIVPLSKAKVILVSQVGEIFEIDIKTGALAKLKIPKILINEDDFKKFTRSKRFTSDQPWVNSALGQFGVKDAILIKDKLARKKLLISANYFDPIKKCVDFRIFKYDLSKYEDNWETVYISNPCISQHNGMPSWGGGLAFVENSSVLLSLGDAIHDGVNYKNLVSDINSDYGKVLLIDFDTKSKEIYSVGHRNPQGIIKTNSGNIIAVEHGPEGGDEINLILKGKDYGWPISTFGVNYNDFIWPLNPLNGSHDGYEQPLISWVPNIGPSDLTEIVTPNSLWKNDIIVSSLRANALLRLKFHDGRVNFIEVIEMDRRLRKVASFENRIFLKGQTYGEIGYFDIKVNEIK